MKFNFNTLVNSHESFTSFEHAFRTHHGQFISHPEIPPSERTVVVAVSGGVDSAMTAQLFVSAGVYRKVVAVHMRNWDEIEERGRCSGEKDAKDAAAVCAALGIELETVDYSREYFTDVFQHLLDSYAQGHTPSPDVLCNRIIKFHLLLEHVRKKHGEHAVLATGHYARIQHHPHQSGITQSHSTAASFPSSALPQLFIGLDPRKDQSYFLSSVSASALRSCIFPMGWMEKQFLKRLAARWERKPSANKHDAISDVSSQQSAASSNFTLPACTHTPFELLSRKRESMGICFIGKRSMQSFLGEYITLHPGEFIDVDTGAVVGQHEGWEAMTVGQKAAISGQKHKFYVCGKMSEHVAGIKIGRRADVPLSINQSPHAIYVCATRNHPALYSDDLFVDELRWINRSDDSPVGSLASPLQLRVKIRSSPGTTDATLSPHDGNSYRVSFRTPQFAIASGQTCVFYDERGTWCLGEARIASSGKSYAQQGRSAPFQAATNAAASSSEDEA
jgi:tRNA U34 2-thiouridine synthase MnmA/TrmU